MLLADIKNIFRSELGDLYAQEEIDHFFYLLMEHYLQLPRFSLALTPDYAISKEDEAPFFDALTQLRQQRPIQYVMGTAHFMGMDLLVNESVLIPRPETEDLVRWMLDTIPPDFEGNILDIGTGSGCIAIALAQHLPKASVTAMDISAEALEMAQKNAASQEVVVQFVQADVLEPQDLAGPFQYIVSNPPYVRELERAEMHKNVLDYEPDGALFVPDDDPLRFYRAIGLLGQQILTEGGSLFLEINQYLQQEMVALLSEQGYGPIAAKPDFKGNNRMLQATYKV